jgi:hypothetical protein
MKLLELWRLRLQDLERRFTEACVIAEVEVFELSKLRKSV